MAARNQLVPFIDGLGLCGFTRRLIKTDYKFVDFRAPGRPPVRNVALAAFGTKPFDFHTACVAVVKWEDPNVDRRRILDEYWCLGAPIILVIVKQVVEWWVIRSCGEAKHKQDIPLHQLQRFFEVHKDILGPARILRAKRPFEERQRQLDFVDAGLLPALNHEVGCKLHLLLEEVIANAVALYENRHNNEQPPFPLLFRLVFELLAGKILMDKGVVPPLDFKSPTQVLSAVSKYYRTPGFRAKVLNDTAVATLVSEEIGRAISFQNLTPESLGHVYEETLVTKETRKKYGTHCTPSYIADYITWRLPIEDIPVDARFVFEPAVGCAAFLVSMMRRMRQDLPDNWLGPQVHKYFLRRFSGFDVDLFAVETAFRAITLADFPNRDGWRISQSDMWTTRALEDGCRKATILLANPPFESFGRDHRQDLERGGMKPQAANMATEFARRAFASLPEGALAGVVLPRETLMGSKSKTFREELLRDWSLLEVCLLPDHVFTHSDAESGVLLARKERRATRVRFRHVRERDRDEFPHSYSAAFEDKVPNGYFRRTPDNALFVPLVRDVWEYLQENCGQLGKIADVGQGLTYDSPASEESALTTAEHYFAGAVRGYQNARCLLPFSLRNPAWMNLDEAVVNRPRRGATTGIPQVLFNYSAGSRGPWRVRAAVDRNGSPVTSSLVVVRPFKEGQSLELISAFLNGPVTNAFFYAFSGKRALSYPLFAKIPFPTCGAGLAEEILRSVLDFKAAVGQQGFFTPQLSDDDKRLLLARIDALVLKSYNLPQRLLDKVIGLFKGMKRRGLEFHYELSGELLERALRTKAEAPETVNKWSDFVGMWSKDTSWDEFLEEIEGFRRGTGEADQ